MTTPAEAELIESRHPLSEDDVRGKQAFFTRRSQRAASFVGSRREAYDEMTAETPRAEGVALEAADQDNVHGWWVRPTDAPAERAVLFIHGGGYMQGSAKAYCGFASQIAVRTSTAVFVADYPLAPEHPFPAAYDAAVAARRWLGSQGITQIALAGDSAGGGLALATLVKSVADSPTVAAAVVFSPWTDLALTGPSLNNSDTYDPIFRRDTIAALAAAYLGDANPRDGRASPLYGIPNTLPPLAIQVGTDELLLDDARRYAALAAEKGGEVRLDIFEGLFHVFQRCTEDLASARYAFDIAANFLSKHWK